MADRLPPQAPETPPRQATPSPSLSGQLTPSQHDWLLRLMALACLLHAAQLVLYPVNAKWWVALSATLVYGAATQGIRARRLFGYGLAFGFPLLAAVFVGLVLLVGPPPGVQGELKFNPLTAVAAVIEVPAVLLAGRALFSGKGA